MESLDQLPSYEVASRSRDEQAVEGPPVDVVLNAVSELQAIVARLLSCQAPHPTRLINDLNIADVAEKIILARTETNEILDDLPLLRGPALDILLDLFVNDRRGRPVSVSEASIAGRVPITTGLRWVKVLIKADLVEKKDDPLDSRRAHIFLTPEGHRVISKCIYAFANV